MPSGLTTLPDYHSFIWISKSNVMKIEEVKVQRLYMQVADQLSELIDNGTLKPGQRLPSERDLVGRFNVSHLDPAINRSKNGTNIVFESGLLTQIIDFLFLSSNLFDQISL